MAQFAAVTAVLVGAPHRLTWIIGTAICGACAALFYAINERRLANVDGRR